MLACAHPALDGPVILFKDVIEILHGAMLAVVGQIACGLEHGNGGWISGVLVGVDDPRRRMVRSAQGFGERSAAAASRLADRRKSIVLALVESRARWVSRQRLQTSSRAKTDHYFLRSDTSFRYWGSACSRDSRFRRSR